jgi:hypothetical protein
MRNRFWPPSAEVAAVQRFSELHCRSFKTWVAGSNHSALAMPPLFAAKAKAAIFRIAAFPILLEEP